MRSETSWNDILWLNRRRGGRSTRAWQRHALILAGGSGTRLAHMTREMTGQPLPKQFCSFVREGATLLQLTAHRAHHMVDGRLRVVVKRVHNIYAQEQLGGDPSCRIITQPCDCGTALGLLLGLVDAAIEDPHGQVIVLPADHGFADERVLYRKVDDAFQFASAYPDRVVLLAAIADRAATDYGWIVPTRDESTTVWAVDHFVEKPDTSTAEQLLDSGAAWNTMMMVGTTRALVELFLRHEPTLVRMFIHHAGLPRGEGEFFLERAFASLRPLDLSADVLEKDRQLWMLTLPESTGWTDLGTEDRMRAWQCGGGASTCPSCLRRTRTQDAPRDVTVRVGRAPHRGKNARTVRC